MSVPVNRTPRAATRAWDQVARQEQLVPVAVGLVVLTLLDVLVTRALVGLPLVCVGAVVLVCLRARRAAYRFAGRPDQTMDQRAEFWLLLQMCGLFIAYPMVFTVLMVDVWSALVR